MIAVLFSMQLKESLSFERERAGVDSWGTEGGHFLKVCNDAIF